MNALQKVFEVLLPARAGEALSDWEKGKLVLEHFSVKTVSEELMLEALVALLLNTPAPAEEFSTLEPRISGRIDELVGIHVHMNEDCLQDVRSWLEAGMTMPYVKARIETQRTIAA